MTQIFILLCIMKLQPNKLQIVEITQTYIYNLTILQNLVISVQLYSIIKLY